MPLLVILGLIGTGHGAYGLAKFLATAPVGHRAIDPIVNRGSATSPHLHTFWGSTTLLQMTAPELAGHADIVGKGTNMSNPDDTAAYWAPTLVWTRGPNAGEPVPLKSFRAYYRCWNHDNICPSAAKVEPWPNDLRLVSGNAAQPAGVPLDTKTLNWMCDQRSTRPGPFADIKAAKCHLAGGTVFLTAHADFPTCWNGQLADHTVMGNTADNAHFRYEQGGSCPAGFPRRLPELRMDIKYNYQGDGSDVALSSDLIQWDLGNMVAPGQTLHADVLSGWLPTGGLRNGLKGVVDLCVNRSPASWCEQ